jgi:hypothetical protein
LRSVDEAPFSARARPVRRDREDPKWGLSEFPDSLFLRTLANRALEELEDGLVDRAVPFDS